MNDILLMLYYELLPTLLQGIAAILGVVLLRAANTAKARWGIEIEAKHREALQSALMTGAAMALAKGLGGKDATSEVLRHVLARGAPDAARFFGLDARGLEEMALAKIREVLQSAPYIAVQGASHSDVQVAIADARASADAAFTSAMESMGGLAGRVTSLEAKT